MFDAWEGLAYYGIVQWPTLEKPPKRGGTPPGGRTKRDLFYLKGMGVYFMKRMVVQKLSRYNNSD